MVQGREGEGGVCRVRGGAGERGRGRCVQGERWCRGEREREVCAG